MWYNDHRIVIDYPPLVPCQLNTDHSQKGMRSRKNRIVDIDLRLTCPQVVRKETIKTAFRLCERGKRQAKQAQEIAFVGLL